MHKYTFGDVKDINNLNDVEIVCTIETSCDIDRIITEFRGDYVGFGYGYNNPNGSATEIVNLYTDCSDLNIWNRFLARENDRLVRPSSNGNANRVYMYGDIRRVLGNILYMLYLGKDVYPKSGIYKYLNGNKEYSVEKIVYRNKEYTDIDNVSLTADKRLIFRASSEGKKVKICIPISLEGYSSKLYKSITNDLYCLEDEMGTNLRFYDIQNIYNKASKSPWSIDRFWGKHDGYKGIFYYFNNEIIPQYAVKRKENGDYTYKITDVKKSFFYNEVCEIAYIGDNVQYVHDFFEDPIIDIDKTKHFEQKFKKEIWHNAIYESEITVKCNNETFVGKKKESDKKYIFSMEGFEYEVDASERNVKETDYYYEFNKLGTLKIDDEFSVELGTKYSDCILIYKDIKVTYDTLEKIGGFLNSPKCPKGINNSNLNVEIYPLSVIMKYIKDSKNDFIGLKDVLKEMYNNVKKNKYLKDNSITNNTLNLYETRKILYPAPNVSDNEVVKIIYEAKRIYDEKGNLPNLAVMGGPGTGKSTLVNRISEYLVGDNKILHKSTSDLKGAYVGQTAGRMFDLLKNAAEKEQIIFIDEAYNLQKDQFGKEALEMILPLLTGDRKEIESPAIGENKEVRVYNFEKEGKRIPPIWFAGYEHEMRKMLSENPGLYRRMIKITLSSPTVDGLFDCLLGKCINKKLDYLKEVFENSREAIRNYFGWATSKEMVNYFGNYAGVDEFFITCKIRLCSENSNITSRDVINEIIEEKKREIKKQYKAILTEIEKIEFEVQNEVDTVLDDVKGNDKIVHSLREIVDMMLNQKEYFKKGINLPKGALLVGPPGTGKTMLARAIAGELQSRYRKAEKKDTKIAFISTIATELNSSKKINALFNEATEYDLSVIFIDEIDAIGKHRNMLGARPELLIQLMKEMDGFESRNNVFVMSATNDPESLDPALKRPGRFDRTIEVPYPDKRGRTAILYSAMKKLWIFKERQQAAENLALEIAEKTIQYAPANLINLVNEAAILYCDCENGGKAEHRQNLLDKDDDVKKYNADILEMLERFNIGELNSGIKESDFQTDCNKGCSAVAIHEVGHAMISLLLELEPFSKITIISRGNALGYVSPNPKYQLRTKRDFINQIRICLGGRVAEELFYDENISTGAVQDIQEATNYAENMITLFGMSEVIGPMAVRTSSKSYLGNTSNYKCSDSFRYEVDDAIRKLIAEQMSITRNMLANHKEDIRRMAKYIFDKETVTGEEFKNEYKRKNTE